MPPLQAAETRNKLSLIVGYRNPVSRARDSTKILRLRLIHHRQKIPICRTSGGGDASPILPLDPPLNVYDEIMIENLKNTRKI